MKSIFDGWENQSRAASNGDDETCAFTFLERGNKDFYWSGSELANRFRAIGEWIIANMDIPKDIPALPLSAVIWANDTGKLDIEGFKMIDLLCQGYVPEDAQVEAPILEECND